MHTLITRLSLHRLWREYRGLAVCLALMLVFRASWADWVVVPTGSMNPTIVEGDRVLIDKRAFGMRVPFTHVRLTGGGDPARGDIVVFDSPATGISLVKRVIGVPGDVVALDGEALIINGVRAQYSAGDVGHLRDLLASTAAMAPVVLREQAPGTEHDVLLLPSRLSLSRFGPVRIPEGRYLMLGDNRDNSADSRYFGLVPRDNSVGRASRVVVSLDPEHYFLPRSDRFLLTLN